MTDTKKTDNRRIAKNAVALYFRMFVTMLIGLYTSRVILNALGVTDYGIYGVVGGFVSMFTLISSSISASVSRFLTYELGKGNSENLRKTFTTSIFVLSGLSVLLIVVTETVGLWYLYNKMVIPPDRLNAAFWCFQFSLFTMVLTLISQPYTASIIAHERMDVYAYLAILESILKLGICFAVLYFSTDKLILYGFLLFVVSLITQFIYMIFCHRKFEETSITFAFNKKLFMNMFSFAGWNFIGSSAAILTSQGSNLLLNWAGGPMINASYTVANSASGMVTTFVNNFTQAFNPQITKRYAAGEYRSLVQLLFYGSKYSYFVMYIVALPIMLNADFLLKLWLGFVPVEAVAFIRLMILANLFDAMSRPIVTAKNATGNIRNYQIVVGGVLLLTLPLAYMALKMGMDMWCVTAAAAITSLAAVFTRMYMMRGDFPLWSSSIFVKKVILKVISVSILSAIIPVTVYILLPYGWSNLILTTIVAITSCIVTMFYLGCDTDERIQVISAMKALASRILNKNA